MNKIIEDDIHKRQVLMANIATLQRNIDELYPGMQLQMVAKAAAPKAAVSKRGRGRPTNAAKQNLAFGRLWRKQQVELVLREATEPMSTREIERELHRRGVNANANSVSHVLSTYDLFRTVPHRKWELTPVAPPPPAPEPEPPPPPVA